ncbi:General transcription factor II-I repeat domain-containing protein 2A [Eumeta japonica]|uniref:General transcription factor II-I repeat domain-containing protein 2A n=1 Tax=Eumeta variegata TaxID=151549 RepID=A0A4C1YYD0_EUMVA|nr:General transcription factor II-I repeat domain-containing protein 2A [Eumeta japonica]
MMANDIKRTLIDRMSGFESYSIAFDDITHLSDTAQLAIFIRGVDKEFTLIEELLALQLLKRFTPREDIFNEVQKIFYSYPRRRQYNGDSSGVASVHGQCRIIRRTRRAYGNGAESAEAPSAHRRTMVRVGSAEPRRGRGASAGRGGGPCARRWSRPRSEQQSARVSTARSPAAPRRADMTDGKPHHPHRVRARSPPHAPALPETHQSTIPLDVFQ